MRTRKNVAGAVVITIVALGLAGCVQPPSHIIPTSEPSTKPVFPSDAAALAAAKKAYVAYLAVSDQVAHDGGIGIRRLAPLDSPAQFKRDTKAFEQMQVDGHHTIGMSTVSNTSLQSNEFARGRARIVAYLCLHIGGTQLLDSSGADVGANRPLVVPLEVSFVSDTAHSQSLLIDRSDVWSGTNFCS